MINKMMNIWVIHKIKTTKVIRINNNITGNI
jgi:hypothetical protein